MNATHLSEEQFGDLLSGTSDAAPAAAAHLADCPQCRAELSDMRATMSLFRDTVIPFAEAQSAKASLHARRRTTVPAPAPGLIAWSLGAAATLALVSLTVGGLRPHVQVLRPAAGRPAAQAGSTPGPVAQGPAEGSSGRNRDAAADDDRLLSEISQDLSTPLPPSLAPLAGQVQPGTASPSR